MRTERGAGALALGAWSALAALAALAAAPARAEECARYEPTVVQLDGELRLKVFPGPPHYHSFDTGDQPESVWLLVLTRPLCIDAAPTDADNASLSDIAVVEVIARAPLPVAWNGKPVTVEGMLSQAHGGHPHAAVLLRATHTSPRS